MKTCPYCAEEILDAAIVCKHCGRDLAPKAVQKTSQSLAARSSPSEHVPPFVEDTKTSSASPAETQPAEAGAEAESSEPAPPPAESSAQPRLEAKKRNSIWWYAIGGGLVFVALAAIPRLLYLSEIGVAISQGQLSELAFRAGLQDLAFAFAVNWVVWSLVIAGSIAMWRWNRWAVIVPLLLLVGFLLAGSGQSVWPDFLGIANFQLPSFSASTSAPVVTARNTNSPFGADPWGTAAANYWSNVTLTVQACEASPTCRMVTPAPAATLEPLSSLADAGRTAIAIRRATVDACEASPTCELVAAPDVATMFARQTAQAGE